MTSKVRPTDPGGGIGDPGDTLTARANRPAWKIAPGEGAEHWPDCLHYRCIGLGWMKLPDYRVFNSEDDVLEALREAYPPPNEAGSREGAARSIWHFVHNVQIGDIVIANNGRSSVAGIGQITSAYLPPSYIYNPVPHPPVEHEWAMWRRHLRHVNWIIRKPVDLGQQFFAINTVTPLTSDQVEQIANVYLACYPGIQVLFDELLAWT